MNSRFFAADEPSGSSHAGLATTRTTLSCSPICLASAEEANLLVVDPLVEGDVDTEHPPPVRQLDGEVAVALDGPAGTDRVQGS